MLTLGVLCACDLITFRDARVDHVSVGFLACTLLLTHPSVNLSILLEEYDLPSLGAADVEWRELFSGRLSFEYQYQV